MISTDKIDEFMKGLFSNSPTFDMNFDMDMENNNSCDCGDSCSCTPQNNCGCIDSKPEVYGFKMTVGPDGIPKFQEWGNMKNPITGEVPKSMEKPKIAEKAIIDFIDNPAEGKGKIIAEMPGVNKDDIKITYRQSKMHIQANGEVREYKESVGLPQIDETSIKATYKNGVLEVTFDYDHNIKATNVKIE